MRLETEAQEMQLVVADESQTAKLGKPCQKPHLFHLLLTNAPSTQLIALIAGHMTEFPHSVWTWTHSCRDRLW